MPVVLSFKGRWYYQQFLYDLKKLPSNPCPPVHQDLKVGVPAVPEIKETEVREGKRIAPKP